MTVGERVKAIPERFIAVPLSILTELPALHEVWMRPCPFCHNQLSNRLFDLLQCGRREGKTYVQLGEWVDEQLRRLNESTSSSTTTTDSGGVHQATGERHAQDARREA